MKIIKLTLENFRLFEKLEIPFLNSNFIVEVDSLISEIFVLLSNEKNELPLVEIKLDDLRKQLSKDDPILIRIENIISRKKITI